MNSFRRFVSYAALPAMAFWSTEVAAVTDFGQGRPIIAKDLSGKKICWSNGSWTRYAADGQFSSSRGGRHTWWVPEPGVVKYGRDQYAQMEVLADGRIHRYWYCNYCGNEDNDGWGTPCN
jgi:hypothetical protein